MAGYTFATAAAPAAATPGSVLAAVDAELATLSGVRPATVAAVRRLAAVLDDPGEAMRAAVNARELRAGMVEARLMGEPVELDPVSAAEAEFGTPAV